LTAAIFALAKLTLLIQLVKAGQLILAKFCFIQDFICINLCYHQDTVKAKVYFLSPCC